MELLHEGQGRVWSANLERETKRNREKPRKNQEKPRETKRNQEKPRETERCQYQIDGAIYLQVQRQLLTIFRRCVWMLSSRLRLPTSPSTPTSTGLVHTSRRRVALSHNRNTPGVGKLGIARPHNEHRWRGRWKGQWPWQS